MPKHIGIVAVTSEGAALCYRTICQEGEAQSGYAHPEVTLHTFPLSEYMRSIEAEDWAAVGRLLLESAGKLARVGAAFAICPDNTAHQGLNLVRQQSPIPLAAHRRGDRRARRPARLSKSWRARDALADGRAGVYRRLWRHRESPAKFLTATSASASARSLWTNWCSGALPPPRANTSRKRFKSSSAMVARP